MYDRRLEVEALLEADETRLGETFRWTREGLTYQQQAERAGGKTGNYGYNNAIIIRALIEGFVPNGPTLAVAAARKARAWLKEKPLSDELRKDIEETERQLMLRASDREAQESEEQVATAVTKQVVAADVPGIYDAARGHGLVTFTVCQCLLSGLILITSQVKRLNQKASRRT